MNKVFKIPIMALAITLFFACCKKDNPKILGPEDYRVTKGNQTFGAYINGQPWVPDYSDPGNGVGPISVSIYRDGGLLPGDPISYYLWVRALKNNQAVDIYITSPIIAGRTYLNTTTGTWPSVLPLNAYGSFENFTPYKSYVTNNQVTGFVDILRVDTFQKKIEAKFEFEAISNNGEKVKVTNGYFKRNY